MAEQFESTIRSEEVIPALAALRTRLGLSGVIGLVFKPTGEIGIVGDCDGVATQAQLAAFELSKRLLGELVEQLGLALDHTHAVERVGSEHGKPVKVN